MIGTLATPRWVKTDFNYIINEDSFNHADSNGKGIIYTGSFNRNDFSGSLATCVNGCNSVYAPLAVDWCDIYDYTISDNCGYNCDNKRNTRSLCRMFVALSVGASIFEAFEIISILGIIIWSIIMLYTYRSVTCYCCAYSCSICSLISHYIAIIAWVGITGSRLSGSCNTFPSNGTTPNICSTDGPRLAIAVMVFMPLIVICFIIISYYAKNNAFIKDQKREKDQNNNRDLKVKQLDESRILTRNKYNKSLNKYALINDKM